MISKAKREAQSRYDKNNTRQIILKLNNKHDADVISKLENVDNRQGYIKELIRTDLKAPGEVLPIESIRYLVLPIAKQYEIESISVFGSYSRNEAQIDSDIDLLIKGGQYTGLYGYIELKEKFESSLGKKVDLLTEAALRENKSASGKRFRKNVEKDKILIYERD